MSDLLPLLFLPHTRGNHPGSTFVGARHNRSGSSCLRRAPCWPPKRRLSFSRSGGSQPERKKREGRNAARRPSFSDRDVRYLSWNKVPGAQFPQLPRVRNPQHLLLEPRGPPPVPFPAAGLLRCAERPIRMLSPHRPSIPTSIPSKTKPGMMSPDHNGAFCEGGARQGFAPRAPRQRTPAGPPRL
jgi:hypothetical protein